MSGSAVEDAAAGCKGSTSAKKFPPRIGISPAIYRPRNHQKAQTSLEKVSRKEFGTPRPRTPKKFRKKVGKVQKNSQNRLFFGLFRPFSELFGGSGSGGPKLLSGDFFETFLSLLVVSGFPAL